MEIHKPKPWHGWRELLKEVAIIVLGVLIALSAEQVVDALHWRHKVAELRAAMTYELTTDDAVEASFRISIHDCLARYLDHVQAVAEGGADRAAVAALGRTYPGYGPATLTWDMEGWRSFLAADGAARMPSNELASWSQSYITIPQLQHYGQDEREAIGRLQAIRPAPGRMSPQELESLAAVLQRLRSDNDWIENYANFFFHGLQGTGLKPDPAAMQTLMHSQAMMAFRHDIDAANLHGCEVTPDLAHPHLRVAPSMPAPRGKGG